MARRSHALAAKNSTKKLSMLRVQSRCRQFCRLKAQVTQSEWTARPYILRVNPPAYLLACCKSFHLFVTVKPGFHMIASIAAIAQKNKFSDRWRVVSIRSLWSRRWLIDGRWPMAIAAITAIVAIIWKPGLRDRNTYTTLTDDLFFGPKMHLIPLTVGCYIRKWNSSHNKCVDPSWLSKATTTTMKM